MNKPLLAAAALAFFAASASAITLESAITQGGTVVTDYSGASLVSFDIDFRSFAPAVIEFRVDSGDMLAPITLSAVLRNFTGSGFSGFAFTLDRGVFASAGTVTPQFGGAANVLLDGNAATITFSALEFLDVEVGDAFGTTPGATNWGLSNLMEGDRFTLSVTPVPEPGTVAMLLAGLGVLGFMARRRPQG
jgi:hypothetical protein